MWNPELPTKFLPHVVCHFGADRNQHARFIPHVLEIVAAEAKERNLSAVRVKCNKRLRNSKPVNWQSATSETGTNGSIGTSVETAIRGSASSSQFSILLQSLSLSPADL